MPIQKYSHIKITKAPLVQDFTTSKSSRGSKNIPDRNREQHSNDLKNQLREALSNIDTEINQYNLSELRNGMYLEFKGELGEDLVTKSLENISAKIRLLNIKSHHDEPISATVFVPNEKKDFFINKINKYKIEDTDKGKPKNKDFVNSVSSITKALVESFWNDPLIPIPSEEPQWCEVWLRINSESEIEKFEHLLKEHHIESTPNHVRFPERAVKIMNVNRAQLEQLIIYSDNIAEYRLAKESASFWTEMPTREQSEWVAELLTRIRTNPTPNTSICILDTGVNNGHSLLAPILSTPDCQSVDSSWGTHDHDGHGTMMAGITAYGSLENCLSSSGTIALQHQLESVKILPPRGQNPYRLWGAMTSQGVSHAEIQAPNRKRVICMAVTSKDTRDRGRPSSWSATLDNLAYEDDAKRLFIVSAGNAEDFNNPLNYPTSLITDSIHDPAQAWNAVTVGAYTALDNIRDPSYAGYHPLANRNALSPFTTTSSTWDDVWPLKPEIVMEGGNLGFDSTIVTECPDLSMLTTNLNPISNQFSYFNMTSLATAQASWLAAQIQDKYPDLWPETVRALMIHSAKWTDELKSQFKDSSMTDKENIKRLLRICGYGVPSLERALHSASNSLTLIAEEEIQPFTKDKTKDMHFHELPWPKEALQGLPPEIEVEMRVTLSYFIEPAPGEIGWKDKYRYASHMLHFEINSPGETEDELIRRINKKARNAENGKPDTKSAASHWVIGQARDKGSIHSDIWQGTAAELADSNKIVIYPGIGWWRERKRLGKYNNKTRYSLVVSITTTAEDIDIYTPVLTQIEVPVSIEIEIN
jgi:hypothetical protein